MRRGKITCEEDLGNLQYETGLCLPARGGRVCEIGDIDTCIIPLLEKWSLA